MRRREETARQAESALSGSSVRALGATPPVARRCPRPDAETAFDPEAWNPHRFSEQSSLAPNPDDIRILGRYRAVAARPIDPACAQCPHTLRGAGGADCGLDRRV